MTSPAAGAPALPRSTKRIVVDPPKDGVELVGKVLAGRYIVEAVIGKGGMGTVLRVRHATLGRKFALKVLRREIVVDPPSVERFLQEAKIMASIRHPNLVEVTDFGELTRADVPALGNFKQPFFVMELLEGETLADLLRRGGPLDARTAARIFKDVADALAAAHDQGVVHRDLKPDNIFLASAGAAHPTPKILDFGVAKLVGASKLTRAGVVFGTPYYMSPEQATGQAVDHKTDQYALGIVMYEALTGGVPFDDDTHMGVMTKHAFVAPEPITAVVRDPARLGAIAPIVMRCLEKRAEARFASCRELAAVLFEIGEGREASTPTPPAPSALRLRDTGPQAASGVRPTVLDPTALPLPEKSRS
ncbi:MAG TPA: serine/threonine-protein kinase, partial [Polyangiaceae bacterium]|nr:serine/threonine-protein kinase [Polyangiaceae bacterium]